MRLVIISPPVQGTRNAVRAILIGWSKALGVLPTSDAEAALSALRLRICGECDRSKQSSALKIVNGEAVRESGLYCGACKCPCKQKTLVVQESCPLGKW